MPLRRPRALLITGSVLGVVALAIGAAGCAAFGSPAVSTVEADGTRVFDLTARSGESEFLPGEKTPVTMTPGESVVLRSESPDYGGTLPFFGGSAGSGDRFDVLELRAAASLDHVGEVPDALVPVERLDPAMASTERSFDMDGTQINQHQMSMNHIDEVVELGATEIWNVTNGMAFPHNFHVHDVQFQVLTIGGEPPPPALAGWKDTVYLRPNTQYRLILRFDDYADPDHPYMYHCHLLRHEDSGMMGQFLVLEPGQTVPDTFTTGTMETDDHEH